MLTVHPSIHRGLRSRLTTRKTAPKASSSRLLRRLGLLCWVLWLLLSGVRPSLWAAIPPESATPLIYVVPNGAPLEQGREGAVRLLVAYPSGQLASGLLLRTLTDRGRVLSIDENPAGIYNLTLQAPASATDTLMRLSVQTMLGGVPVEKHFEFPILATQEGVLTLEPAVTTLKLGRVRDVPVTLTGRHPGGRPVRQDELVLQTNVGRLEQLKTLSPGRFSARYVLEERNIPQTVVMAAFVGEGPQRLVSWAALKLIATPEIPIETEPGARVWIEIAGSTFGPVLADASGLARVKVQVGPGARTMNVRVVDRVGNSSRSAQPLGIPRVPMALLQLDRRSHRMDEPEPLGVTLVSVLENGAGQLELPGRFEPGRGQLGGVVALAPGIFFTTFRPASSVGRADLIWRHTLPDSGEEQLSASVEVLEGAAASIALKVEPARLRTDDPPAAVNLKVFDRLGNPATGVEARLVVPVGSIEPLRRIGPGEFVSAYRPPQELRGLKPADDGQVRVPLQVAVTREAGPGPVTRLELGEAFRSVRAGGPDVRLRVRARNRSGAPVRSVAVRAALLEGQGTITERESTDERGVAELRFQPGREPGATRLSVQLEDDAAVATELLLLHVLPPPAAAASGAPSSGTPVSSPLGAGQPLQPLQEPLRGGLESTSFDGDSSRGLEPERRRSPEADLSAEAWIELVPGRVKAVEVVAFPNVLYVNSRQPADITVRLRDYSGNLVEDPTLQVTASAGAVSPPRRSTRGAGPIYEAQYIPPPFLLQEPTVRVTASNPERDYFGVTEVALVRADGRFLGSARVGILSNFGAFTAPILSLQVMSQLPVLQPALYGGISLGYYSYGESAARLDLAPLSFFACYRQRFGQLSPYVAFGPTAGIGLAQRELVGEGAQIEVLRAPFVFPGLSGKLGLELAVGPGGIAAELELLLLNGGMVKPVGLEVSGSLGGALLHVGYVTHF